MFILEREARDVLKTLKSIVPKSKDDVRQVLLRLKREELIANRQELKAVEARALKLAQRVDYTIIRPRLVHVGPDDRPLWNYYRRTVSSAPWSNRVGRANYVFCQDAVSGGILGVMDLGSDVQALGPRDRYIGWSRERKFKQAALNCIVNLGTCVAMQPFGWLCGGKYQAVASTSSLIVDLWQRRHGSIAAAVMTTSLFGKSSMYERLKEFEYIGDTPGQGCFHLSMDGQRILNEFARRNGILARVRGNGFSAASKLDILMKVCAKLGVPDADVTSYQPRGCYIASLGDDAIKFLRGDVKTFTPRRVPLMTITEWWLDRWYKMRWPKVSDQINAFDWRLYGVDAQIDLCESGRTPADDGRTKD